MERKLGQSSTNYFLSAQEIRCLVDKGYISPEQLTDAQAQSNLLDGSSGKPVPHNYAYVIEVPKVDQEALEDAFRTIGLTVVDMQAN